MDIATATTTNRFYRCCAEWEHNGYDDSDWFVVAFDATKNVLTRIGTGTTRFASSLHVSIPGLVGMTPEMAPRARAALVNMLAEKAVRAETSRVLEPKIETLTKGVRVRLTESHRCAKKTSVESPCPKGCDAGYWANPRNKEDRRPCFACKGAGKFVRREKVIVETTIERGKRKGEKKSGVAWENVAAGLCGEVIDRATFGTFHRGGYNRPDRHNTTVYVRLDDGREVQVSASKLRLDAEPAGESTIRARIEAAVPLPDGSLFNAYYQPFATSAYAL